ncbi:hypothetical protein D9756_002171 [Leucocoprinus leucothites]|uniref:Uncharacterized protein n=1 Tax=Leucocoprinus leucothites TaxID=201217 RepID=A0A8H5GC22_9AGAR|nr:hypothetical protein D9756_002171 [Leucoagaricus leucothites]
MSSISRPPPLPGFGINLDDMTAQKGLFPCALDPDLEERESRYRMPILTLREIRMLQFMNQITDKNDWEQKVFDETIAQKWKTEVMQGHRDGADFTLEMADYCIEELKYKAELLKKTGYVHVYNGDVVKSDCVIPADLQDALRAAVARLEDVPAKQKDWHPGSDDQVLDLVHPSLFPLVYGTSRILPNSTVGLEDCISRCGEGEVIPQPPEKLGIVTLGWPRLDFKSYSRRFQWLPCDVDISGDTPKIVSYINNLHPKEHLGLYGIIERVIEKIIPLWNATLSPLDEMKWPKRIHCDDSVDYNDLQEAIQPNAQPFSRDSVGGKDGDQGSVDLKRDYSDTGLQVIVKLANIHLTPEKPSYNGGTWHVEGQLNEHICATAIYYYDVENITPSHLAFRQASDVLEAEEEIGYEQGDWAWLEAIFGLQNEEPAIQTVGSVQAREGRVVTFPNLLQHCVQPFKLADPTRPGHRKILALFLVDPHTKIISTANIPCQQRDWWGKSIISTNNHGLGMLPVELQAKVVQDVDDFPISLEKAKQLREELMEERKHYMIGYHDSIFREVTISLCEH